MLHTWLRWKARVSAARETRAYGALLLLAGFGVPLVFGIAVVVMMVTFSWTISAEFAWTWAIVATVVLFACMGALLSAAGRRRRYSRVTRRLMHRAAGGNREAMLELARSYAQGCNGLVRDRSQAAWWWRRLAEDGDAEGAYQWGRVLLLGEGVMKDPLKGRNWIRIATQAGHPQARAEGSADSDMNTPERGPE